MRGRAPVRSHQAKCSRTWSLDWSAQRQRIAAHIHGNVWLRSCLPSAFLSSCFLLQSFETHLSQDQASRYASCLCSQTDLRSDPSTAVLYWLPRLQKSSSEAVRLLAEVYWVCSRQSQVWHDWSIDLYSSHHQSCSHCYCSAMVSHLKSSEECRWAAVQALMLWAMSYPLIGFICHACFQAVAQLAASVHIADTTLVVQLSCQCGTSQ